MKHIFLLIILTILVSCNISAEKKKTSQNTTPQLLQLQTDLQNSMERGNEVYTDFCLRCHLAEGQGIKNSFPPLAQSDYLVEQRSESIKAVKYGQSGEIIVNGISYNGVMAPMGLSDQEVADVMNYIMNNWGNNQNEMVTKAEVISVEK